MKGIPPSRVVVYLALVVFLGVTVWLNLLVRTEDQFVDLAQAFLHGSTAFLEAPGGSWADTTPYNDKFYWPLGPLPAVLLMPFQWLAGLAGIAIYQGYFQPLLVLALLVLVFRVARKTGYDFGDSAWLAFGFAFATAFLGVAMWPWSWQFSQAVTCVLVFGAILETIGRRRPWLMGTLFALAMATRITAALGILWSFAEILRGPGTRQEKTRSVVLLGLPCVVVLGLLMAYNQVRFDNALDQGYAKQLVPPHYEAARAQGLFSARHLPCNLYHFLLAPPTPVRQDEVSTMLRPPYLTANPWGMSLFITSPIFFYLFGLKYSDRTSRLLWLTALIVAMPIMLYFGVGFRQFGYRYALDFLPLVFFLLMRNHRQQRGDLTTGFKAVLLISAVTNLYLFAGHFLWGLG